MRALVTGVSGLVGRSVLTQLAARQIEVIGVDIRPPRLLPEAEKTYAVAPATSPQLLSELRRIALAEKVQLVIPTVRAELPQMAAGRAAFGPGVDVVIAGAGPVSIAHDLLHTAFQLRSREVAVPPFGVRSDFEDASGAFAALGGPLIVRPRVPGRPYRACLVRCPDELDWTDVPADALLQRNVPGRDYAAVLYRPARSREAAPLLVVLERLLERGGTGPTTRIRRISETAEQDVGRLAVAAVRAVGLVGPACINIRRAEDGAPQVLGLEARFSANSAAVPELLDRVLARVPHRPQG